MRLVIAGCGGFGREVFSIADACRRAGEAIDVVGFLDDRPSASNLAALEDLGADHLGPVREADDEAGDLAFIVAVGDPMTRRMLVGRLGPHARFATLVHPDSTLGAKVVLGPGSVVAAGVRASTNISIGSHVHLDQNVTVGHDCVVGDFARLNPAACVSGSVAIGENVLVGANATILQGLILGSNAVVGAGAVVTRDVVTNSVVRGVPAR